MFMLIEFLKHPRGAKSSVSRGKSMSDYLSILVWVKKIFTANFFQHQFCFGHRMRPAIDVDLEDKVVEFWRENQNQFARLT